MKLSIVAAEFALLVQKYGCRGHKKLCEWRTTHTCFKSGLFSMSVSNRERRMNTCHLVIASCARVFWNHQWIHSRKDGLRNPVLCGLVSVCLWKLKRSFMKRNLITNILLFLRRKKVQMDSLDHWINSLYTFLEKHSGMPLS